MESEFDLITTKEAFKKKDMSAQVKNSNSYYPIYDISEDKRGTNFIGEAI